MKKFITWLSASLLVLAGCSEGNKGAEQEVPQEEPAPTVEIVQDPTEPLKDFSLLFTPQSDSFSFSNFQGGSAPADLTVNMSRRLYGDSQVCSDVTDNQCTPYPVILQLISQANRSMQGGLCEGLAVLSLRLANDPSSLAEFQNVDNVSQLVKEDPALLSELAYWYVTQFATEVQAEASSYLEKHPAQLAEILLRDFEAAANGDPSTGYTIGIYSSEGGHAVTPYRVEEVDGGYRIYIYDSNWPNEERWIDVDGEGWTYALAATNPTEEASAWGGSTGTMELTPMVSRSGPFTCGFCPQEEGGDSATMLTVASSGSKQMSIQVVTEDGKRLGYFDGQFVNEIPGATYRYLISGPTTADPVLVFLPPGIKTFDADVEEIKIPAPSVGEGSTTPKQDTEESTPEIEEKQQYSLLLLNEEKSVQIEAAIQEPDEEEGDEDSLIGFSEERLEIAEVEDAIVAVAIDALEVEIELDEGQEFELELDDTVEGEAELEIEIQNEEGEVLAELDVDIEAYLVQEDDELDPLEPEPLPVIIEIAYDEETGEITQEEDQIEAWVASDAEYYQAVATGTLEEVLGESYVEEIEELIVWEVEWDEEEDLIDLTAVLLSVDDDYWEDEQWDEVDYDDEWFLEENDDAVFAVVEDPDAWFIEDEWVPEEEWIEDWEDEEWYSDEDEDNELLEDDLPLPEDEGWPEETPPPFEETEEETTEPDEEIPVEEEEYFYYEDEEEYEEEGELEEYDEFLEEETEIEEYEEVETFVQTSYGNPGVAVLARGEDGYWYETSTQNITQTITTVTTTDTTTTDFYRPVSNLQTLVYRRISYCEGVTNTWSMCGDYQPEVIDTYQTVTYGQQYAISETVTTSETTVTTQTTTTQIVVPASCSQGGFTGLGDWCIVDSSDNDDRVSVAFSVPTAEEEGPEGDGLMDIRIDAETNLTAANWDDENEEHGDPYIYLHHDTDPSEGITVGDLIQADDDGGNDCGNWQDCENPPSTATDEDETPDVTLADGSQVIDNVSDPWDSRIEIELSAGDYVVDAAVYSDETDGWYMLTIRDADVPYPEDNGTNV
jgi:hypothetical protein